MAQMISAEERLIRRRRPAGTSSELNPISCDRIHWENNSSWVKYQSQGKKRVPINSDSQDIEEVHMTEALGPNVSQSEFQFQDSITGVDPSASTHTQPPPKHAQRLQQQRGYHLDCTEDVDLESIPICVPFEELQVEKKKRGYDGDHDRSIRLVIVGDRGVGKSCLMKRFVDCNYEISESTISHDIGKRFITIGKRTVRLEIWDTAGMEKHFNSIPNHVFRRAEGAILVFDITDQRSFIHVHNDKKCKQGESWVTVIRRLCDTASIILVGHKSDSDDKDRKVEMLEAQRIAKQNGMIPYIEASSKDDINVDQVFYLITQDILKKQPNDRWPTPQQIPQQQQAPKKKCNC